MPLSYYFSEWFLSVLFLALLGLLGITLPFIAYVYLPPHPAVHLILIEPLIGLILLRESWIDYQRDRVLFGTPPLRNPMNERQIAIASMIGCGLGFFLGIGLLMTSLLIKVYTPNYFEIPGTCLFLVLLGIMLIYLFGPRLLDSLNLEWDRYQVIKKQEAQGGYTKL